MSTSDDQSPITLPVSADSILASRAKLGMTASDSPPAAFRMLLISLLSGAIGLVAGICAFVLYKLIGLFTNVFFFHRWSADFVSAHITIWVGMVIVTPVIGGLIVGVNGQVRHIENQRHGIPEAMGACCSIAAGLLHE